MPKSRREPVNLTDFKVRSLKPDPNGEYIQGDAQVPGFGIRMRPNGTASYLVMKRLPGDANPLRVTLGRVGEITLAGAREWARQAIAAVRDGVDVNAQKRRARERGRRQREDARAVHVATGFPAESFGAIATHYIAQECSRLARGGEVESIIRRGLL